MNSQENAERVEDQGEAFVADYLYRNRDFFQNNLDLLTRIRIPHNTGKAISLVEKQLAVFREKCSKLENQLVELISVARDNESVDKKMHALACNMMHAETLADLQTLLAESMLRDFSIANVALHLCDPGAAGQLSGAAYSHGELQIVRDSMQGADILCGRISDMQSEGLFGENCKIGSAALIWLQSGDQEIGLLALGSAADTHFTEGKGKVFLQQLKEIVSSKIAGSLKPE